MMKTRLKFLPLILIILACGLGACEGDKGEIGPQGDPGATGATGATGSNGTGFDELTQYGNIEVTFSGKRIDDITFSQKTDFIYMPTYGGVAQNSRVDYDEKSDSYTFNLARENKGKVTSSTNGRTDAAGVKNTFALSITKDANGVIANNVQIYVDVVTTDFKTFEIYNNDGSWNIDFTMAITNYVYTPATGKLTFNFAYTIPAANNNTGSDISVTGKANVIVFQSLNPI